MIFKKMRIDDLIIPEWNAKQTSENMMRKLKTSIGECGYVIPVVVNSHNNHVISGSKRVLALRDMGVEEIDVVLTTIKIPEKEMAFNLALNRIDFDWDKDKLKLLLERIDESPVDFLKLTGFASEEIQALGVKEKQVNGIFQGEDHWILPKTYQGKTDESFDIRQGDVFQLGNHRLMCGDSTNAEDVAILMDGVRADTVFTDPPYDFRESLYNSILFDNTEDAHVFIMNDDVNMVRYLKNSRFEFQEFFVADFGFAALINNCAHLQHILVSHETKGNPRPPVGSEEDFSSVIKMKYRNTLDDDRTEHFHQKSIAFIQLFLVKYAVQNVLDIFGGSGSTMLACERTGKTCFMMELEVPFCQMIIDRWEKVTGGKAVRIFRR
ncbi:MAG: DNA modification methylase [Solobacterium sp.]|nr:DNA modification methylase [Solobacterium sp.]